MFHLREEKEEPSFPLWIKIIHRKHNERMKLFHSAQFPSAYCEGGKITVRFALQGGSYANTRVLIAKKSVISLRLRLSM